MSVNIKQLDGTLKRVAGNTILLDASCAEVRSGTFNLSNQTGGAGWAEQTITFSTPMPDTDYIVIYETTVTAWYHEDSPTPLRVTNKTVNGFKVSSYDFAEAGTLNTYAGNYYAFKLVTLDGYTALQNKVNNPDSTPTENSTNLCESGGIYEAIKNASSVFIGTADEWDDEQNKTDYQLAVLTDTERINAVDDTTGDIDAVADYSGIWTGSKGDWDELTSAEKAEYKIINIIDDESGGEYQYSTSEQYTGKKWIDGKKIYQKTINFGALPNASSKDVNHNISNIDKIINYYGSARTSAGSCLCLPYTSTSSNTTVQLWVNSTLVRAITATDRTDYSGYITIEYTKN